MAAIASSIVAIIMAMVVLAIRMKAAKKPANAKKIILPPIFMSTGALMYFIPQFRITPTEIIQSVILGLIFSIFLIRTSSFEKREGEIYLKRSKAFVYILLGLLTIRTILKFVLSSTIEIGELTGVFWMLAFAMIVPWRIAMYVKFKKVQKSLLLEKQPM